MRGIQAGETLSTGLEENALEQVKAALGIDFGGVIIPVDGTVFDGEAGTNFLGSSLDQAARTAAHSTRRPGGRRRARHTLRRTADGSHPSLAR